ncbi:MAG: ribonuclease HII [Sporolactobacillus sp.]
METIAQVRAKLACSDSLDADVRDRLSNDPRIGVQKLLDAWQRRQAQRAEWLKRFKHLNAYEERLHAQGFEYVGGIDEAGRGPLAGPVVAACVILRPESVILGLNDSKQLTPHRRDMLFDDIRAAALAIGIGEASAPEIDRYNIYQASKLAMMRALEATSIRADFLLIDAMQLPVQIAQESLIKGDARSNSIAAASIIAKVTRDRLMQKLDQTYAGYGFANHKGYGTADHLRALKTLGPCPEHRLTFSPVMASR